MSPQKRRHVLLAIVGFLLLTNPLWLFPHEGDAKYTYDRSEIVVRNGTFVYDGTDVRGITDEVNSLNPIACQPTDDDQSRACALDHHLVGHPAITVPEEPWNLDDTGPEYVRIDGAYYRRIQNSTGAAENRTVTYDVERVTPQRVLATSATNLSGGSGEGFRLEVRIAISGDTVTSFEDLDENALGNIYRINGSYYTVVKTDRRVIDHGFDFLRYAVPRYLVASSGFVLVGSVLVNRYRD